MQIDVLWYDAWKMPLDLASWRSEPLFFHSAHIVAVFEGSAHHLPRQCTEFHGRRTQNAANSSESGDARFLKPSKPTRPLGIQCP